MLLLVFEGLGCGNYVFGFNCDCVTEVVGFAFVCLLWCYMVICLGGVGLAD